MDGGQGRSLIELSVVHDLLCVAIITTLDSLAHLLQHCTLPRRQSIFSKMAPITHIGESLTAILRSLSIRLPTVR
jgi:hypothetical protein